MNWKRFAFAIWPLFVTPIAIGLISGFVGDDKSPFLLSVAGTLISLFYLASAISRTYGLTGFKQLYLWVGILILALPVGAAQWWFSFELMLRTLK